MSKKDFSDLTICEDGQKMLAKAEREGVETVWDRKRAQEPHCGFCELGLSCRNCAMGPCRIDPFGHGPQRGVCGADAHVIVARNVGRCVAGGAAAHSDHGRDLVETLHAIGKGETGDYAVRDPEKLARLAGEMGIEAKGKDDKALAAEVSERLFEDYGIRSPRLAFLGRLPRKRLDLWNKVGITPRSIDREIVEMMHRTHMGVDNEPVNTLLHAARVSLSDGWAGSLTATELSDVIFGTPTPRASEVNLGVLKEDHVNVLVHGHNPIVSETILSATRDPELLKAAQAKGAKGINLAGLCCTGNELLMRQGIPLAGNHLMSELAVITGAVDLIIVDYQCIMPGLVTVAGCYHTKVVSTSPKAKFTGAEHVEFTLENAGEMAKKVIRMAIEAYEGRDPKRVDIPVAPVAMMSGFSNEAIIGALGGTPGPLLDAIKAGQVRGAVGIVGCNNPRQKHDYANSELAKELIKRDILVLVTGCATVSTAKQGLLMPEAAEMAGPGLKAVCRSLGIPPVLHVGSCVDNSRILDLCAALANALGVDISDLPVAAAAPEWYSEKAVSIGLYAVASGVFTVLGVAPPVLGSSVVTGVLTAGLEDVVGATFAVEPDPHKMADLIDARIKAKRKALGLSE